MSGKIPSDSPKSHQTSHKEDVQEPRSPSQVQRSSIPPSLGQEKPDVEKMTSSVKGERKRKKEETEEKEKELDPSQHVEKKRDLVPESKKIIETLHEKVSECLGPIPENIDSLEAIADFCFGKIKDRVSNPEYIKSEEISKIYELLFETELKSICQSKLSEPLNPINPHPAYVFYSLNECLLALSEHSSFDAAIAAGEQYIESNRLGAYFEQDLETRKRILPMILQQAPNYQELIDNCPLYTTTTLLNSKNIHPAFVLRNRNKENQWIFKPTASVTPEGLHSPQADYSLANSEREQLVTLLNLHNRFPIPATYLIEVKGSVGSAQIFLNGPKEEIQESNIDDLSVAELQSLLIFDIIFANCDRHMDNIISIRAGDLRVNGIDHDACFAFDNRPLKIDYLRYARPFNCPFDQTVHDLLSDENIDHYTKILKASGQDENAVEWMQYAAETIRKSFGQHRTAELVAKNLMAEFSERYVI